ncbi:Glutathione S-transferase [Octadecabacter temperatus]|uniref:Glutaredoxin 2 n=1 Tax=Octadecabacter temperatus TaxID=1458307 RepID=A0A0K0Y9M2_9RHOB|nr:glutathione S-transferase [Octadecabacter temperatus]AKS47610.1 glutaredoxin 2 [Octadecabacter temperatus]SIO40676.1 Glutathione S-transferase [Octadecabacter temperatus]
MTYPILYSFRRCPYAMRARLAIASSGLTVELREILLRDKAPEFLATSPKGTVPVLIAGNVIEESYDVMRWALEQSDPENLLTPMTKAAYALIEQTDGPFKTALDRTKYAVRHPDLDPAESRATAASFIEKLDTQLNGKPWLFGDEPSLADLAILPFVRQFARTDLDWWDAQPFTHAQNWLAAFKASDRFASIMTKYTPWKSGDDVVLFP